MFSELMRLLLPFRRGLSFYVLSTLVRQGLVVGGGYGLVLLIRSYEHNPYRSVWIALAVLIGYKLVLDTLDQVMGWNFARYVSYPMFKQLSVCVFTRLLSLDQAWHHASSCGARRGEIANGLSKFAQTSDSLAREVCPLLATATVSLFLLRNYLTPVLWMGILPAGCLVFFWLSYEENRRCAGYRATRYKRYASDYSLSIECMEMHADVVRYNQEGRMEEDYRRLHLEIESNGLAEARIQTWFGLEKGVVILGLQVYLLAHWIGLLTAKRLDGAMLVYLFMLSDQLCSSLWGYAGIWSRVSEAWEPIKLFLRITSASSGLMMRDKGAPLPVPDSVSLEFRDVEFSYRADERVLDRLSFLATAGSKIGLIGPTGCGKSTVLNLVERLYDAHSGNIYIAGRDVHDWPVKQLHRMCTCLSQNGGVFFSEATLLDAIRFAKPEASFSDVVRVARLASIHDEIMALQDGYQTRAGEHGKNLSGGQRQRVAIAQALLSLDLPEKRVVLLDECTSNLDAETEMRILHNIWPLLNGKTVLIVTHRIASIETLVDEVLAIDRGRIAFRQGSPRISTERDLIPSS